ncbi:BTAD domain-containing putative transcriptional regulator [Streptomyces sp. NPDC093085]|uniref:AfsR/SARP family transcriptional regulator n=1 Tax=Streptomyces sp. NPDC093085 TaxID=3155068 RepID=UPI0034474C4E
MDFHLLGPVELRLDGQPLALKGDKERAILASLALAAGRPVSINTLMSRLWEGDTEPPEHARADTHTYVSRLRRKLRRAGKGPGAPEIASRAHTYVLRVDGERVDWHRFQQLVSRAGTSVTRGDDEQAVALLTHAEQLWQGEALAGLPGAWAASVRAALGERRLAATVTRLAAALRTGRAAELVDELSTLADRYPGDETIAGHLMLARYGCGRYPDALRVYEQVRLRLRAEYGAPPGAELTRIHRSILARMDRHELVRKVLGPADDPEARAVSVRQDAERPATARPGVPEPARQDPPVLPAPTGPRNLPQQSPLVGRVAELRALSSAIDNMASDGSVISLETVSGMAGVGKTALALHTARRLAERFPAGQLYLDLRAHAPAQEALTPAEALATLLRLIGAPADEIPMELEARTALWRTMLAERRAVIVLDDAADADQVGPLLPGGSASLTIITSRRHLAGLPYARSLPLDVLPVADAITLFRKFAGEERTRDIQEATRIVTLCGFLPLAIELVAHRFRVHSSWSLTTLRERLARPSGRLGEIRDSEDRGIDLAFDLSYRTLSDEQRAAFRRLGLHPGADFTLGAAAALLDLPEAAAERLVEALLTSHLLRESTPDRYRFHDLLAEYARSRAIAEDDVDHRETAVHRVIKFYIRMVDHADRVLYPRRVRLAPREGTEEEPRLDHETPADTPANPPMETIKNWFDTERGNLLAAERYARTHGHRELAAQLAYGIAEFLNAECHWQDAANVLGHAVTHWTATADQHALCRTLLYLGAAQANIGRYAEAGETDRRALEIARATGDREAEAEILRVQGVLSWHLGENRTALAHFQDSFAIKSASGDTWDKARAYNNVAVALIQLREHARALGHFRNAIEAFSAAGDRASAGKALNNLGDLQMRLGDPDGARHSYEEAISSLESTGNRYDRATTKASLADYFTATGSKESALALHRECLTEFRSLNDRKSEADTLISMGEAYRRTGGDDEPDEASRYYLEALEIAREIGASHQVAQALHHLAQVDFAQGRTDKAVERLEAAVATAARTDDLDEETGARNTLAEVWLALGEKTKALKQLRRAFTALRHADPEGAARIRDRLLEVEQPLNASTVKQSGQ